MHERCPVCGLKFDRESGYFLGAMYFSYLLMAVPAVVVYLWISRHTPWASDWMLLWTALITLPLVPPITRVSRVLWIYFDRKVDPE